MKKIALLSLLFGILPLAANAQDDMYFSPKKSKAENSTQVKQKNISEYGYGSCNRDVDEYNRHRFYSYYNNIDNDSISDAIDFNGNTPDSLYSAKRVKARHKPYRYDDDDYDYSYSRRMRYFDDFWFDDPWLYGYPYDYGYWPYYGYYGYAWGRPWRYGYYGGWYDPWFYGYDGWYSPWYYRYGRPYWGTTVVYRPYNRGGVTGTSNHGWVDNGRRGHGENFSGYRGSNSTSNRNVDAYNRQNSNGNFSGYRGNNNRNSEIYNRNNGFNNNANREFNQSGFRNESTFSNSQMNRGGGGFGNGGSFGGGNRGGGFSGGGAHSSGGGHFGGRR